MSLSALTEMDGKVISYLELADKAMREGKYDKARVYVEMAKVAQAERKWAWQDLAHARFR